MKAQIISTAAHAMERLIWNRFTMMANARTVFAKAQWSGEDRDVSVNGVAQYIEGKGIEAPIEQLHDIWRDVETELVTSHEGGAR